MGKSGTSHLLSYSLEKPLRAFGRTDRFPIQNIGSPYKTLLYFLKGARRAAADQTGTEFIKGGPYPMKHGYSLAPLHMYLAEKVRSKPPICTV